MDSDNILQSTRSALGLANNTTDFNSEIIIHINSALGVLNQNGIGKVGFTVNDGSTWLDFKDETQIHGNEFFTNLVPSYIFVKTKLLFDPPPPSIVAFYNTHIDEMLWRLRMAYEEDNDVTQIE